MVVIPIIQASMDVHVPTIVHNDTSGMTIPNYGLVLGVQINISFPLIVNLVIHVSSNKEDFLVVHSLNLFRVKMETYVLLCIEIALWKHVLI